MQIKIGDFVRFVDENIEGTVSSIQGNNIIGVTDSDGFEIPVLVSKVTKVQSVSSGVVDKDADNDFINAGAKIVTEELEDVDNLIKSGVFLAVSHDSKLNLYKFKIVNESSLFVLISVVSEKNKQYKGLFKGVVAPYTTEEGFSLETIGVPTLVFNGIKYTTLNIEPQPNINRKISIKATDFTAKKQQVGKDMCILYQLDEAEFKIDTVALKESMYSTQPDNIKNVSLNLNTVVVDLHIEKLVKDFNNRTEESILNIQLDHFESKLDEAIRNGRSSIIFIHGLGRGILKKEIQKIARQHNFVKSFAEASSIEFGYGGATEFFI